MFKMWRLGGEIMKNVRQQANECYIPRYMQDILTNNYCPNFLRMSMVRECDDYLFRYQTDRYKKLDIGKLDTHQKMILLKSLISLKDRNEDWLIQAENYLIEPDLVYSVDNQVGEKEIRLLFYPDYKQRSFSNKIVKFAEKIINLRNEEERNLISQFENFAKRGDWNRTKLFLDKNILRMETRTELVV